MVDCRTPIIVTCDSNYFEHFAVFIQSFLDYNKDSRTHIHLHAVNMSDNQLDLINRLPIKLFDIKLNLNTKKTIMCSGVDGGHPRMRNTLRSRLSSEQQCFCAHNKIFLANEYLAAGHDEILVMDVDCIFRKNIDSILNLQGDLILQYKHRDRFTIFKEGCMLIRRNPHTKILFETASDNLQHKFRTKINYDIDSDHIELGNTYESLRDNIDLQLLPFEYKDTDHKSDTYIWSGKGDRKLKRQKYLNTHKRYYDIFCDRQADTELPT